MATLALVPASRAIELRIMSFNVQQPWGTSWDGRKAAAATLVNRESPDVMGTQEATKEQLDHLSASCPGYSRFGAGRDGGDAGETSAIFWKSDRFRIDQANSGDFWLSNTPATPSRYGGSYNRIATYVRLVDQRTDEGFMLFNIHNYMPAESDFRMRAAKLLVSKIASRSHTAEPVFVTGDFNSTEGDAVTLWMKSGWDNPLRLRDSYREVDPSGSVTTGFGTKFDYIYLPDESKYKTLRSHVPTSPVASDHYPIVADVVANGPSSTSPRPAPRGSAAVVLRTEASRSILTVRLVPSRPIDRIELIDPTGAVVKASTMRHDVHRMDVSALPRGMHFVRIRSEGTLVTRSVVVP